MYLSVNIPEAEETALLMLGGMRPRPGAEAALMAVTTHEALVWLANEHGVSSLVQRNIAEAGLTGYFPPTEYQCLRNQSFKSVARNSFIMSATASAVAILNEAGYIPILLKGTALEMTVYGGSGLRPMTDADIMLGRDECMGAWLLLQRSGYTPLPVKSWLHRMILMHIGKHLPSLIKGGFSLEIHHSLWGEKAGYLNDLIVRDSEIMVYEPGSGNIYVKDSGVAYDNVVEAGVAAEKEVGMSYEKDSGTALEAGKSITVRIPPPALHFLYLVAHLVKHESEGHSQLRLYNDLVAMLLHYGAESILSEAFVHAREVGMERMLKNKLGILSKYMGVELPTEYRFVPDAAAEREFVTFLEKPKNNAPVNPHKAYRQSVRSIPGLHRKLLFLAGDIFPGVAFMKKRYGKATVLSVLPYYFMRVGKILWMVR
jgi:hypothetical protein